MIWKNKIVLVTGSEGMIGKELVKLLRAKGAIVITIDLKDNSRAEHYVCDITNYENLQDMIYENYDIDYVFHLFGIKGNPRMTAERPVDFMAPMLRGDTNSIVLAQEYNVKKFLYTSSIAVENPDSDEFPAWAKMTAETLIEAMKVQYPEGTEFCIVRPCNVYGQYDNLEAKECMVISDLIRKGIKNKKVKVWNDGGGIRDFINAKDCAKGMIQAMEEMPDKPVNLCSGKGVAIKNVANIIGKELGVPVEFGSNEDTSSRVMELNWNFKPEIDIETGIKEFIKYVK